MDFYHVSFNQQEHNKNFWSEYITQFLLWLLFFISLILLFISSLLDKQNQTVVFIYDISIGLLCSSIVSLTFMYVQKRNNKNILSKKRMKFYDTFYIYCYNILNDLPKIIRKDCELNCENYIIEVHREYHEYYKKIVAKNYSQDIVNKLSDSISSFYQSYHMWFDDASELFKLNIECFDERDSVLLNDFFMYFRQLKIENNKNKTSQILAMAQLMTFFREMIEGIKYLQTLKLVKFAFKKGKLSIDLSELYNKEPWIKGIDMVGKAKRETIDKYYSK